MFPHGSVALLLSGDLKRKKRERREEKRIRVAETSNHMKCFTVAEQMFLFERDNRMSGVNI